MDKLPKKSKFFDVLQWVLNWDITLKDGTKCKVKDNVKSIKFKQKTKNL